MPFTVINTHDVVPNENDVKQRGLLESMVAAQIDLIDVNIKRHAYLHLAPKLGEGDWSGR